MHSGYCVSIIPRINRNLLHFTTSRTVFTAKALLVKTESKPKSKITTFSQEDLNRLNKIKMKEIKDDITYTDIQAKINKGASQMLKAIAYGFLSATVATIAFGT